MPLSKIIKHVMTENIPLNALFEVTYACNLKCRHCYVSSEQRPELSTEQVRVVLDQLADNGCLFLTLSGGEPFTRKDIFDIASYANRKGFAVRIFTNGTLITPEIANKIANLNLLEVGISLYGAVASTHEAITAVPGSFKRSVRALKLLRERNVKTVVKFTLMKPNVREFEAVRLLAKELGAYFQYGFAISPKTDGSKQTLALRMDEDNLRYVLENEFLYPRSVCDKERRFNLRKKDVNNRIICSAGRDMCSISPYGDLQPCVMLPIKAGNLCKTSFKTLWANSKNLIYLRSLRYADLSICSKCSSFGNCFRCQGLALLESGDLLGACEFACKIEEVEKSLRAGDLIQGGVR